MKAKDSTASDQPHDESLEKCAKEIRKARKELGPRLIKLTADTLSSE